MNEHSGAPPGFFDPRLFADPRLFGPFATAFQAFLPPFNGQNGAAFAPPSVDLEAVTAQASASAKGVARCQLEIMGLANRRAQAYMQIPTQIAACRTPRDLVNEQMSFWRTAVEHYTGASHRLWETWSSVVPGANAFAGAAARAARERDYITFSNGNRDAGGREQLPTGPGERRVA